jgi:hypothetical protein
MQDYEHHMSMYAKIQCLNMHVFFVINFFKFCIVGILCHLILHKSRFGQITEEICSKRFTQNLICIFIIFL